LDWGGVPVWNMYGLTENANWAAGTDQIEDCAIGRLWGGQARLRTEAGEWVEHGEGELFLRSASLMSGYLNQPDLTAEVMQDGWYQTGDVVQLSATGQLHLVGRNRYAINMDGTKIYPEELDLLFERHSALTDVCTFAMPDPAGGEQVGLAFVALDEVTDVDLRTWASERLRPEAIPTVWQQMEALPRSDRGKLNRDLVRDAVLKAKAK
jgi:acyl-CoA synthetase (AMP-forming)/AMP-acid ligase II